jgi:hypothetical protein
MIITIAKLFFRAIAEITLSIHRFFNAIYLELDALQEPVAKKYPKSA